MARKRSAEKTSEPKTPAGTADPDAQLVQETGDTEPTDRKEVQARFHQTLGEAMWLLFQSPDYRSVQIGAIERLFLPACGAISSRCSATTTRPSGWRAGRC